MKTGRKFLAIILVICMAVMMLPMIAFAADPDCGEGPYVETPTVRVPYIDYSTDIDLVKASDVDRIPVNGTVNYTLTITNTGKDTLSDVEITDDHFPADPTDITVKVETEEGTMEEIFSASVDGAYFSKGDGEDANKIFINSFDLGVGKTIVVTYSVKYTTAGTETNNARVEAVFYGENLTIEVEDRDSKTITVYEGYNPPPPPSYYIYTVVHEYYVIDVTGIRVLEGTTTWTSQRIYVNGESINPDGITKEPVYNATTYAYENTSPDTVQPIQNDSLKFTLTYVRTVEIDLDEPEVPLTDVPQDPDVIEDEEIPLDSIPKTGDHGAAGFAAISLLCGAGLAGVLTLRKKQEDQ